MESKNKFIFDDFYSLLKYAEKRRKFHRIKCDIDVTIRNHTHPIQIQAKCIDISLGGIKIKMFSYNKIKLYANDIVEIWIYLENNDKPMHRWGKVAWFKQTDIALYRGGLYFTTEKPVD